MKTRDIEAEYLYENDATRGMHLCVEEENLNDSTYFSEAGEFAFVFFEPCTIAIELIDVFHRNKVHVSVNDLWHIVNCHAAVVLVNNETRTVQLELYDTDRKAQLRVTELEQTMERSINASRLDSLVAKHETSYAKSDVVNQGLPPAYKFRPSELRNLGDVSKYSKPVAAIDVLEAAMKKGKQ